MILGTNKQRNYLRRLICSKAISETLAEETITLLEHPDTTAEQLAQKIDQVKGAIDKHRENPDPNLPLNQKIAALTRKVQFHLDKDKILLPVEDEPPTPQNPLTGEELRKAVDDLFGTK